MVWGLLLGEIVYRNLPQTVLTMRPFAGELDFLDLPKNRPKHPQSFSPYYDLPKGPQSHDRGRLATQRSPKLLLGVVRRR
jgi:hypothetical protein